MALHVLVFLTFVLVSMQFLQTEAGPVFPKASCSLSPRDRTDCGFGGIGKEECISKGCCFDSSISGVIWCYKDPSPEVPEIESHTTVDVQPEQPIIEEPEVQQDEECDKI